MGIEKIAIIAIAIMTITIMILAVIEKSISTPEQICASRVTQTEFCLNLSKSKMNEGKN